MKEDGHDLHSIPLTGDALEEADVVVLVTDHSEFDYRTIFDRSRVLVDARNATAEVAGESARPGKTWIVKGGPNA